MLIIILFLGIFYVPYNEVKVKGNKLILAFGGGRGANEEIKWQQVLP